MWQLRWAFYGYGQSVILRSGITCLAQDLLETESRSDPIVRGSRIFETFPLVDIGPCSSAAALVSNIPL